MAISPSCTLWEALGRLDVDMGSRYHSVSEIHALQNVLSGAGLRSTVIQSSTDVKDHFQNVFVEPKAGESSPYGRHIIIPFDEYVFSPSPERYAY